MGDSREELEIVPLPDALNRRATDLLVRVFVDDPSWSSHVPLRALRRIVLRVYYSWALRRARRAGEVDAVVRADQVIAVALWDAPRRPGRRALSERVLALAQRWWRGGSADPGHAPHWHLEAIVVGAVLRGSGMGSRMLAHGLRRVDRDRMPARLEATSDASQRLYERFGFVPVEATGAGDRADEVEMLRPASP